MNTKIGKTLLVTLFLILFNSNFTQAKTFECWDVITQLHVDDHTIIQLVDVDCDKLVDVIQKFNLVKGKWVKRNWWYIYQNQKVHNEDIKNEK